MKSACFNRSIVWLSLALTGCASAPLENAKRLIEHPEFKAAAVAAPNFTSDALLTINRLEYEIQKRN